MGVSSTRGLSLGVTLLLLGCGRSDPIGWADIYASGSDEVGTSEDGSTDVDTFETVEGSEVDTVLDTESVDTVDTFETDPTDPTESTTEMTTESTTDPTTESTTDPTETTTETGCEPVPITLTSPAPRVVFLIDQGSHMDQAYAGTTRWDAVGQALFDPMTGIAPAWEDELELGLTSFTSFNGNQGGMCPALTEVAPALVNADAMAASFTGQTPEDENPLADALAATAASLGIDPDAPSTTIVVLAGRDPDTCAQPNPQQGANAAVAAATAAFGQGIVTRLIAVGTLNQAFAQAFANAGLGLPADASWDAPTDIATLIADLEALLQSLRPCSFALAPVIAPAGASACTLTLGGVELPLDQPEGWTVDNGDTLSLLGDACTNYQQLGELPELICSCEAF